jgi:hypothetical protein
MQARELMRDKELIVSFHDIVTFKHTVKFTNNFMVLSRVVLTQMGGL